MPTSLFQVTLKSDTGLPRDSISNAFAVEHDATDEGSYSGIADAIHRFYTETKAGNAGPLSSFLSPQLSNASDGIEVAAYNIAGHLDGSPHGSPVWVDGYANNHPSALTALPGEVAVVLTLESIASLTAAVEAGATRPKQRRRGRLFIGPLNRTADDQGTTNQAEPRPGAAFIDVLHDAAEDLYDDLLVYGTGWCVWSRANAALYPLARVFTDNAFDTMRSRGLAPTARTVRQLS